MGNLQTCKSITSRTPTKKKTSKSWVDKKLPIASMDIRRDKTTQIERGHKCFKEISEKAPSINDSTMDEGRHDSIFTDPKLHSESDNEVHYKEGKAL